MKIPNLKTKSEIIAARRAKGEPLGEIMLELMFGSLRKLPEYNEINEVASRANKDLKRMDFSEMSDYLDSLEQIAEYWKDKAEHYLSYVDAERYELDEDGNIQDVTPSAA